MDINRLYELAKKENISIYNCPIKNIKGIYFNVNDIKAIGLNYSILSDTSEKCVLAEELGHYYYDATYKFNSSLQLISKQEYKALKWRSLALVSRESFLRCFSSGIYNLSDIAEKIQVDLNMVEFAYNYYINNGILTKDEVVN